MSANLKDEAVELLYRDAAYLDRQDWDNWRPRHGDAAAAEARDREDLKTLNRQGAKAPRTRSQ